MLHPVGPLPAGVYWRRRVGVLLVLLALLAGGAWLGWALWTAPDGTSAAATAPTDGATRTEVPDLEQVVPSPPTIRTPTPPVPASAAESPPEPAGPSPGSACSDDMIDLVVRAPATVAVGSKPTFELVVTNVSEVPCSRVLDKGLQELVLIDGGGNRIWGSNDCFPEESSDSRTVAPGEEVVFPLVWGGLTSEPTCTVARSAPAAGSYVVRGRLDTKTSGDTPITLE